MVDRGAAESVVCRHLPVQELFGRQCEQEYHTASGATLVSQRLRCIKAVAEDGIGVQMTYQVTGVAKPLPFLSIICCEGSAVVSSSDYWYIVKNCRGRHLCFSRETGVYMLHTRVPSAEFYVGRCFFVRHRKTSEESGRWDERRQGGH